MVQGRKEASLGLWEEGEWVYSQCGNRVGRTWMRGERSWLPGVRDGTWEPGRRTKMMLRLEPVVQPGGDDSWTKNTLRLRKVLSWR